MKTSAEIILEEIKSLNQKIEKIQHPNDDELLTITYVRKHWKVQYDFIMKLVELGYLKVIDFSQVDDSRKKGGIRIKRGDLKKVLAQFEAAEIEEVEAPDLVSIAKKIIEKNNGAKNAR
jgi:hypothetical protein